MEKMSATFDPATGDAPVKTKDAFCAQHGRYTSKLLMQRWTGCDCCAEESRRAAVVAARKREAEEGERNRLMRMAEATGISPRHIDCTFDNFHIDSEQDKAGQEMALSITRRYAMNFAAVKKDGASLVFVGNVGTGKNHLACAIINEILPKGFSARIVTVTGLLRSIKESFRNGVTQESVISDVSRVDLLVIDEVSAWSCQPEDARTLFEIINRRSEERSPTILIANGSLAEIKESFGRLAEPIFDRLRQGGGLSVEFTWESYRARGATKASWLMDDEPGSAEVLSIASGVGGKR